MGSDPGPFETRVVSFPFHRITSPWERVERGKRVVQVLGFRSEGIQKQRGGIQVGQCGERGELMMDNREDLEGRLEDAGQGQREEQSLRGELEWNVRDHEGGARASREFLLACGLTWLFLIFLLIFFWTLF